MKKNGIKISACMMVKNEEEMLPRCLNSIKHLIDELIIVDTGSTDKTVEIAQSFGAKIYHHPWENNFSKHRNQSLSYATGDWILLIDADEELNAYQLKKNEFKALLAKAPKDLNCYLIKVLDKNRKGGITSATESIRIFRNRVGIKYVGIVHNRLSYSGKAGHLKLELFHYGYALSDEQMQAKYRRTSGLLFKRIEQDPNDFDAYFYLFQVHSEMDEKEKAIQYAARCLELIEQKGLQPIEASFYYSLYYGMASAHLKLSQYDQAVAAVRKGLEVLPDEVDLYYELAAVGYFSGRLDLCVEGGQNYFRVVDEFRNDAARAGTRFVFTTSKSAETTVYFWLMAGLVSTESFERFSAVWEDCKDRMLDKPGFQRELFKALEQKEAFESLEPVASFLLNHLEKIHPGNHKLVLSFLLFYLKDQEIHQTDGDETSEAMFEGVAGRYLDTMDSYQAIPTQDAVILANFMLGKNLWKFFLDLTLVLFERELQGQITALDTNADLAKGYRLIGEKLVQNRKGQMVSTLCRDMAGALERESLPYSASGKESCTPDPQIDHCAGKEKTTPLYKTAFKEVDITPKASEAQPVALQGMAGGVRNAVQVATPLKMQMLLIEDDKGAKLLIVSADLFGFGKPMVDGVVKAAADWAIPPEAIILNASHTHYAPGTVSNASQTLGPFHQNYARDVMQLITQSLGPMYDALEPSQIYSGKASGVDIGINRRLKQDGQVKFQPNEKGEYDTSAPFLLVEGLNSQRRILLLNHGCHPTSIGNASVIFADFPGYLRQALIQTGKVAHVMYLQGAAGDIKAGALDAAQENRPVFCSSVADAEKNGQKAAQQVLPFLEHDQLSLLTQSGLCCTKEKMLLPLKPIPPAATIESLKNNPDSDFIVREWATRLTATYPSGQYPNALALEVQVITLGNTVTWVTFPAEPVTQLGMKLKALTRSPDQTFILGYTNGLYCYLPDDRIIEEGGYESAVSPYYYMMPHLLEKGTESRVLSAVQNCITAIEGPSPQAVYGKYHETAKPYGNAFFTLSGGRCGTQTLSHLLDMASNARVWHHPLPFLVNETFEAYCQRDNQDLRRDVFWRGRGQFMYNTWSNGLIHGETDHNMTPFCDIIAKDIPDAKFVVLIRNPWDFVRSGMRRNYYNGHPWDTGRLRPMEDEMALSDWNSLSQFEKVCWLWNKTYTFILMQLPVLGQENVFLLTFEDMVEKPQVLFALSEFLGLKEIAAQQVDEVLKKKLNAQQTGSFAVPNDWTGQMKQRLWEICGETAQIFGYENIF